jgi:hypothetical protein
MMKSVPLTRGAIPVIAAEIKARRSVTLRVKGNCVAKVQPIVTVSKRDAAKILREIGAADKGDDWADYTSWS